MTLDAGKVQNRSMVFYLKANKYVPEGQESLTNIPEYKRDTSDKKEEWCKKLSLSSEMDINVVHRYSHLGEKLLRTTYNALGCNLTGTLQVCNCFAQSKAKSRAVRKTNYTRVSHPGKSISVDTTGPLPEILIGNRYWICVVEDYRCYSWSFLTKTKSQIPKNIEEFFDKMTSRGTPVKYLCCNNSGEHQLK